MASRPVKRQHKTHDKLYTSYKHVVHVQNLDHDASSYVNKLVETKLSQ